MISVKICPDDSMVSPHDQPVEQPKPRQRQHDHHKADQRSGRPDRMGAEKVVEHGSHSLKDQRQITDRIRL
jgi:hypothetical protein